MDTKAMKEVLEGSEAGRLIFPDVVKTLLEVGVESYFADLVRGEETFYMPNGETHVEKMLLPRTKIADGFSQGGILAAVRAAQADEIRYPEFVKRAREAGVAAYWTFLTGRKVVYFGRQGEFHVEEFPQAKS